MRQAYDYWQNQPGNYRRPRGPVRRVPQDRRPRKVARMITSPGGPTRAGHPARDGLAGRSHARTTRAIQLPPLSSPGIDPPQKAPRPREGHRYPAACNPQEEDTSHRSRPRGERLSASACPRMSAGGTVAIGQGSTDSVGALRRARGRDLGRRVGPAVGSPTLPVKGTVGEDDSGRDPTTDRHPNRSPRAPGQPLSPSPHLTREGPVGKFGG